ncbi:MAG: hypothetical protein ACM3IL_01635, partial [Deltaproteobacteria bacterium]
YLAGTCSRALSGADVDFSCSLLIILTNHGFKPKEDFYKELNSSIKDLENKKDKAPEDVKKLESLARLDKALTENVSLKDAWLAAKNKVEETAQINKEMQKEFDEAVDQFALKTDEILKKYNTEEEARKKFVDDILTLKDYLVQQFGQ